MISRAAVSATFVISAQDVPGKGAFAHFALGQLHAHRTATGHAGAIL
jgi:hypothetical protein